MSRCTPVVTQRPMTRGYVQKTYDEEKTILDRHMARYKKLKRQERDFVRDVKKLLDKCHKSEMYQDRLYWVRKVFHKLMHRVTGYCLMYNRTLEQSIKEKCSTLLNEVTFSFISPVVHRHFCDDSELMAKVSKVKNYIRHKKAHEKRRRETAEILREVPYFCYDMVPVITSYL